MIVLLYTVLYWLLVIVLLYTDCTGYRCTVSATSDSATGYNLMPEAAVFSKQETGRVEGPYTGYHLPCWR